MSGYESGPESDFGDRVKVFLEDADNISELGNSKIKELSNAVR